MRSGATNTFDTAVSGNASGNTIMATVSGFGATRPRKTPIQVSAKRSSRINPTAAAASARLPRHCQPTSSPQTTSVVISSSARHRSARLRPVTSAERATGIDRNRSTTPRLTSLATLVAVAPRPYSMVITNTPGSRNSR
jgi:hypothetical protein